MSAAGILALVSIPLTQGIDDGTDTWRITANVGTATNMPPTVSRRSVKPISKADEDRPPDGDRANARNIDGSRRKRRSATS